MSAQFLCILVVLVIALVSPSAGSANEKPIKVFEVTAWEVSSEAKKTRRFSDLEREAIQPIRRGSSDDLDCAGQTDEKGVLQCEIKKCDMEGNIPNYYRITFKIPDRFEVVELATVSVQKCRADPLEPEILLMQKTYLATLLKSDVQNVLGFEPRVVASLDTNIPQGEDIGKKLSALLNEPYGAYRLSGFRKAMQDLSFEAVSKGFGQTGITYQSYAVASANVAVGNVASHFVLSSKRKPFLITGKMQDLNFNLEELLKQLGQPGAIDAKSGKIVTPEFAGQVLTKVRTNVNAGKLDSVQFKNLELLNKYIMVEQKLELRT